LFFRVKPSGPYRYLQLVENHREGYRTVQRVLLTLGRLDELTATGSTDALLRSLVRGRVKPAREGQVKTSHLR
jgi:hypothetical protein